MGERLITVGLGPDGRAVRVADPTPASVRRPGAAPPLLPPRGVSELAASLARGEEPRAACLYLPATGLSDRWLQGTFRRPPDGAAAETALQFAGVDVSAARDAVRSSRTETVRLRDLVEHATDVITVLAPDGEILFQSGAVTRELGFSQDELVGTDVLEHVHPGDRAAVRRALEDARRGALCKLSCVTRSGR